MNTHILSLFLGVLGIIGTATLVTIAGIVMWQYRGTRLWSFRWQLRCSGRGLDMDLFDRRFQDCKLVAALCSWP